MTLQVSGAGADGDPGMPRGDLYVELSVDADPYFKRDPRRGEDVHVEVPHPPPLVRAAHPPISTRPVPRPA